MKQTRWNFEPTHCFLDHLQCSFLQNNQADHGGVLKQPFVKRAVVNHVLYFGPADDHFDYEAVPWALAGARLGGMCELCLPSGGVVWCARGSSLSLPIFAIGLLQTLDTSMSRPKFREAIGNLQNTLPRPNPRHGQNWWNSFKLVIRLTGYVLIIFWTL